MGRDFDAAPWYWEHVLPDAPPEQQELVRKRLAAARGDFAIARQRDHESKECDWFTVDASRPLRQVRSLQGVPEWLEGIDPKRVEIELRSRLIPPKDAKTLLKSGDDVLVSRQVRKASRLIVVANGSFLLNLPLVNHEHRKLAGKLIDEIRPPGKNVVFLESGSGGPPIRDKDPAAGCPPAWKCSTFGRPIGSSCIWPSVGVIFCFSRWPIFGRPETRSRKRLRFRPAHRRPGRPAETLPRSELCDVENTQLPTAKDRTKD